MSDQPRIVVHSPLPPPSPEDPFVVYMATVEEEPLPPPDPDDPFVVYLRSFSDLQEPDARSNLAEPFARSSDPRSQSMTIVLENADRLSEVDLEALRELATEADVSRIDVRAERRD